MILVVAGLAIEAIGFLFEQQKYRLRLQHILTLC